MKGASKVIPEESGKKDLSLGGETRVNMLNLNPTGGSAGSTKRERGSRRKKGKGIEEERERRNVRRGRRK